jgi:2-keto-4-pentenoate hydratase/2-oxohepta-3-ene-1,7-dioic acid hydratase in catechol pathway
VVFVNSPGGSERVKVELIQLYAVVTDRDGHPYQGLGRETFRVLEDGVEQEIAAFDEAKDHMGAKEKPAKPVLFLRAANTLVGSGDTLEKPALEPMFDYEGEIALVIGRRCRNVSAEQALDYVAGYSCFNDASARLYQISSSQITAGKNAYRSGGFGPWLSLADEVDLNSMRMTCRVNGEVMQAMGLDDLIFSFADLVAYISEFTWLEPGDVVVTGSPEGVGALRNPQVLLSAGDKVEVEVSGVGLLVNTVVDQPGVEQAVA